ncbi:MAG: bifunctional phosphoribosylaminoimidazolecarboxamide formyltransferase/IMP cyclohydrolase [Candidatus Bipolaricaulia bacterium]
MVDVRRALLSVSDKTGLAEFAQRLSEQGVELIASGGTARALREAGLAVTDLAEITGFENLLGGRVKTLHPHVHAAILARRDDPQQMEELAQNNIEPIDLVVVNLYPFAAQVDERTSDEDGMEWVDIGGEALIRAAAKNFPSTGIVVDPDDYAEVGQQIEDTGGLNVTTSRELAARAFDHVTRYNAHIANWVSADETWPESLNVAEPRQLKLRYGENPHQRSALYGPQPPEQLQGKKLSYVNVLDADAALKAVVEFDEPTAVVIKHTSPCGAAARETLSEAFEGAYQADPTSAFGGIVGLNRTVDCATAERIRERFFEVVVAPEFADDALEVLARKSNLRLLRAPMDADDQRRLVRSTAFGIAAQEASCSSISSRELELVTNLQPSSAQIDDLLFAWRVGKHVLSNAIVLAKDRTSVGIGGGQVSRVDAVQIAVEKAGEGASGSVLASDAFFPFPDGVELAAEGGVTAVIQPGGSKRDEEVIQACDEHGIAMAFTRRREFRH